MTHAELVERAEKWLRNSQHCGVVATELRNSSFEEPDAIGFKSWGQSILVECKASRNDFLRDLKKPHRQDGFRSMGRLRYYMAPQDLLSPSEIPAGWGLLEVAGKIVRVTVEATQSPDPLETIAKDRDALYSVARRLAQKLREAKPKE